MASKVVGLTGGIGSGKSAVADLFAEQGVAVIDSDVIARSLTASNGEAMAAIRETFGSRVCLPDGSMDRTQMRNLIFSDTAAKQQLEDILHPLVLEKSKRMLAEASAPYVLLVVPLLFETIRFLPLINCSLVVDCDEPIQLARVMTRDGITEAQAKAIITAQCSRRERLSRADDVIVNNGDFAELARQVAEKHAEYLARFKNC